MPDFNNMKNTLQTADGTVLQGNSSKMTEWAKEPSLMVLKHDLSIAKQPHDEQVGKIRGWLALRDPKAPPKDKKAANPRSTVQPRLIRKQAEWRYSALSEPFLSTEKAIKASPVTWEDAKAAKQNELVLNHQFRNKMDWVKFIDEYVRTDVDEGTVIVRIGWDRYTKMETVEVPIWTYYDVSSDEELIQLQQAAQMKLENPNGFLDLPEDLQESVNYGLEKGVPARAVISGYTRVQQEKVIKNQPTATVMDFDNVYIDPTCNGDIDKANFVVFSFETSKAELAKDKRYSNLDKVNWGANTPYMSPDHSTRTNDSVQFNDDLRKRVVAYEYWGFHNVTEDDELTAIVVTWVGDAIVRMEKNPFPDQALPLVVVPYMPIKKSITGEPDAELLGDNQAILGATTRGIVDLMGRAANSQMGTAKGMLDVVNQRRYEAGQDYSFNPNLSPALGFYQHKYPEIPNSALTMLQLQNQEAESLTGVKAFSGGMSGAAYGDVAAGIRGMLDASSKREMGILRRLASGVEKIAAKFAAMNGVFLSEEETVRITNDMFVTVRREDLIGNFDLKMDIATAEVEESKAQDLAFMLQTIGNNMDIAMVQMILSEIATLKRMPELARRILDFTPASDPFKEQMQQLEMQKVMAEIEEVQSKIRLNDASARAKISAADSADLEFLEQESGTKHAREMQKSSAQAKANENLEITKRILAPEDGGSKANDVSGALAYQKFSEAIAARM